MNAAGAFNGLPFAAYLILTYSGRSGRYFFTVTIGTKATSLALKDQTIFQSSGEFQC
jgi:hypothetical protein